MIESAKYILEVKCLLREGEFTCKKGSFILRACTLFIRCMFSFSALATKYLGNTLDFLDPQIIN